MLEEYRIVYQECKGEIVEKKSRFIASIFPVNTEEAALIFIESIKKRNWNATHNCYAYVIGGNHEIARCSDDGEPSGTAGKPMLDVLIGEGLHDVVIVVTRYFGGTLLGTGGLIRAYQGAVKEGLSHALITEKRLGAKLHIITNYNDIGKLQYTVSQMGLWIQNIEYTEVVNAYILVSLCKLPEFEKKWITLTNGKGEIKNLGSIYFVIINGDMIICGDSSKHSIDNLENN